MQMSTTLKHRSLLPFDVFSLACWNELNHSSPHNNTKKEQKRKAILEKKASRRVNQKKASRRVSFTLSRSTFSICSRYDTSTTKIEFVTATIVILRWNRVQNFTGIGFLNTGQNLSPSNFNSEIQRWQSGIWFIPVERESRDYHAACVILLCIYIQQVASRPVPMLLSAMWRLVAECTTTPRIGWIGITPLPSGARMGSIPIPTRRAACNAAWLDDELPDGDHSHSQDVTTELNLLVLTDGFSDSWVILFFLLLFFMKAVLIIRIFFFFLPLVASRFTTGIRQVPGLCWPMSSWLRAGNKRGSFNLALLSLWSVFLGFLTCFIFGFYGLTTIFIYDFLNKKKTIFIYGETLPYIVRQTWLQDPTEDKHFDRTDR